MWHIMLLYYFHYNAPHNKPNFIQKPHKLYNAVLRNTSKESLSLSCLFAPAAGKYFLYSYPDRVKAVSPIFFYRRLYVIIKLLMSGLEFSNCNNLLKTSILGSLDSIIKIIDPRHKQVYVNPLSAKVQSGFIGALNKTQRCSFNFFKSPKRFLIFYLSFNFFFFNLELSNFSLKVKWVQLQYPLFHLFWGKGVQLGKKSRLSKII